MTERELRAAYGVCERITHKSSTSYSLAMRLFPREIALSICALYAFARTADDLVDREVPDRDALLFRIEEWKRAYRGKGTGLVLRAAADVFHRYDIPFELSLEFFHAMEMDTRISRYERYDDLVEYMEGSAGAIGMMIAYVVGFTDESAPRYARMLGHALQLTNFLRDVREDYELYGRIYLPLEDLERYALKQHDISRAVSTSAFKYLMHDQVARNRKLYREAREGIPLLHPRGRAAIGLAASLYENLLDEIERSDYDVFTKRVSVPVWKKSGLLLSAAGSAALGRLSF